MTQVDPQLHVNPKMLPRLDELEADLSERRNRAAAEAWLGEIEGIDRTLSCLRDKHTDALRLTRITRKVDLGMPMIDAAPLATVSRSQRPRLAGGATQAEKPRDALQVSGESR